MTQEELYSQLKSGQSLDVRNPDNNLAFTIRPERVFETGPVLGYSTVVNGKVARKGVMLSKEEVIDWLSRLEIVTNA